VDFHTAFIVAWAFCLLFYFMEYAVRSAPSVMLPEFDDCIWPVDDGFKLPDRDFTITRTRYSRSLPAPRSIAGGGKYTISVWRVYFLAIGTAMFCHSRGMGRCCRSPSCRGAGRRLCLCGLPSISRPAAFQGRYLATANRQSPNASACLGGAAGQFVTAPFDPRADALASRSGIYAGGRDLGNRGRDVRRDPA